MLVLEGDDASPEWCKDLKGELSRIPCALRASELTSSPPGDLLPGFVRRATILADLSRYVATLQPLRRGTTCTVASSRDVLADNAYWRLDFKISLPVAQTSLKAKVVWEENVTAPHCLFSASTSK